MSTDNHVWNRNWVFDTPSTLCFISEYVGHADCFFLMTTGVLLVLFSVINDFKRSPALQNPLSKSLLIVSTYYIYGQVVFRTSMIFVFQTELSFPVFKRWSNLTPTKNSIFLGKKTAVADTIPETKVKLTVPKLKELRCDWRLLGRLKKCQSSRWVCTGSMGNWNSFHPYKWSYFYTRLRN